MQKLIDLACRLFSFVMVVCLALMVVMVFGNVVLRYGFNTGITISEELSRWLFVWMTFLGAVVALRGHAHLGTDMLVSRLPVAGKKLCLGATHLLMLYLCWMMAKGGWQQTVINLGSTSAVMQASMAWFYVSGVVFAAAAALVIAHDFFKLVTGKLGDRELVAVIESEEDVAAAQAGTVGGAAR
ncbi:TRAP transporter small permease [Ramlibacter henchirensis]|uniref:TRAP transporter small permease protein n=1 Tax=Ramlibacter henchirensis TaxID=204072 RepID=A0A4Z0C1G6_9BURK|nr:TRAP transporter small permease [Ramlibacter henchirensis]TFZ05363.1 TRAP transporter small permease [Ramlibacter henchirensis]